MNEKETKLEEISDKVNSYEPIKHPPIFEIYITVFSILMAVLLFLFPDMLHLNIENSTNFYWFLLSIMPQPMWAFSFFIAGMTKSVGMLIDNNTTRVVGLLMSALLYIAMTAGYAVSFPTIGTVTFVCLTVFTLISIPMVKQTGLRD